MHKIVVQKYGGSSVSTVENIKRVAQRIMETTEQGYQVVVVVSAMGNTTNELISLAKLAAKDPSTRELDLLISVGERVSMSLLAMAIQELGGLAKSFTGSQSGIITTDQHCSASIIEVRPVRIQQALEDGYIAIVAGFQGMSTKLEVTTLGRGGSDTTAVALTAALNATYCEICSDVSGVYSTDPRVVSSARLLDELSLDTAIVMAENGAKVLQVEALRWCKKAGVTLIANATRNSFGKGTQLKPSVEKKEQPVISFDRSLILAENLSLEEQKQLHSAIRFGFQHSSQEFFVLDTRNIHSSVEGKEIASVSVIGDVEWSVIAPIISSFSLLTWWKNQKIWTGILSREELDALVRSLHQHLFAEE